MKARVSGATLALVATLLSALPGWSGEVVSKRPQLVLSIMVDGLQTEYLELLSDRFGPDGFNRLLKGGAVMEQVEFGPGVDAAGALTMLYTGAAPSVSGIQTARVYSTDRRMEQSAMLDASKIGNYTDETLSPAAIRVSTLADEVRIDGGGAAYVHAIAPQAEHAIVMAGHSGNSAFWVNSADGRWATTTHYREVPTAITARNYTRPLSARIDTMLWAPSLDIKDYPALPAHKHYAFRHTFSPTDPDKYRRYKTTPMVNVEVTDLALEYMHNMRLGQRDAMDMLSVGYVVTPDVGAVDSRLETMDTYLRLDRQIGRLLKDAEGKDVVVILGGMPAEPGKEPDDERWGLPSGQFSARKAVSLLNMYLIARLGNGEWVTAYNRGAIYLNHKLIEEKKLDIEEVRTEAAKFLARMSGVAGTYTIDDILEGRTDASLRRNTVVSSAADVYVDVIPGWTLTDDTQSKVAQHTVRLAPHTAPLVIYAPGRVEAARISTPVDARQVAPTVASILRIRSPNAAGQPPLRLK